MSIREVSDRRGDRSSFFVCEQRADERAVYLFELASCGSAQGIASDRPRDDLSRTDRRRGCQLSRARASAAQSRAAATQ